MDPAGRATGVVSPFGVEYSCKVVPKY